MKDAVFNNMIVQLYHADARQLPIQDESIDCVVTSPPYWGLRDYNLDNGIGLEPTIKEWITNMVLVFREVWRVLKPTGTVWMNLGDGYVASNTLSNLTNNHTKTDSPLWHDKKYPRYFRSTRYADHHTSNTYIPELKTKDLIGMPWRAAFALQADGWYLRSDIIWSKLNPMPESVTDRPSKAHEYIFLLTKQAKYYYDAAAIRESSSNAVVSDNRNKRTVWEIPTQPYPDAHFATYPEKLVEPCILAGTSEKGVCAECGKPWERIVEASGGTIGQGWHNHANDLIRNMRDNSKGKSTDGTYKRQHKGWQSTCNCNADIVPATVLDPFVGSGTTLAVAQRLGRKGVGTDLNKDYLTLAEQRLGAITLPMDLS